MSFKYYCATHCVVYKRRELERIVKTVYVQQQMLCEMFPTESNGVGGETGVVFHQLLSN